MPPHGGYPQPRKPMGFWEHKAQIDWCLQDPEAYEEMLHELLCAAYPTKQQQDN